MTHPSDDHALPMPLSEEVACPACGIVFTASPPQHTVLTTADRSRCLIDPKEPILADCPNVAALIEAAWARLRTR